MSAILSGCCKEVCSDNEILNFEFQNFASSELPGARVVRYPVGNLNAPIDSVELVMPGSNSTTLYVPVSQSLNNDYRILLKNNSTYTITNIITKNVDCSCSRGTFKVISSYQLNGTLKTSVVLGTIVITK